MGGAPANFAYHAQELGSGEIKSIIVSSVGDDIRGQEIMYRLGLLSLNKDHISINKEHPTGTVTVNFHNNGKHSFKIEKNVAWDFIHETTTLKKSAKNTDVVCFGTLAQRSPVSRNTIQTFLKYTPSSALRVFDINLRQSYYSREIVEISLNLANILKMNNENDLATLTALLSLNGSEESILRELAGRYNLELIVLTKGEKGSIIHSQEQNKQYYHSGYAIDLKEADTVGAGDAFTAAFAIGILKKYDFDYINDCANRVASFVCTKSGAVPQLPEEIKNLFRV